MTTNKIK